MRLIRELVEHFGGASAFASLMDVPYSTVGSWKARNAIPVEYWPAIIREASARDLDSITYESLTLMHVKSNDPQKPQPERVTS